MGQNDDNRHKSPPPRSRKTGSNNSHQAAILINRATRYLPKLNIKLRRVLGFPFSLELPNGSNIIAVAHSGDTSVGNTANVLIPKGDPPTLPGWQ
jgi:hypothetical protein